MNNPEQNPLRHRMRELLAIPEQRRTDAQWDELIELEILLAPGNREGAPLPGQRRNDNAPGGQPKPHGGSPGKKASRKFHKRSSRGGAR
ncbi:MAG: hypothetical protein OEZ08_09600 [Betaproteobacteria bacterium]|nr:hypothetical protein [Betaproteobacteria bacterium]